MTTEKTAGDAGAAPTQVAFWNGEAGHRWASMQSTLDIALEPFGNGAIAYAAPRPGERVLDVGCGAGASTVALARRVTPGGTVLGVDISAPLLALARARAVNTDTEQIQYDSVPNDSLSWMLADAATQSFDASSYDLVFSRFGVMFFDRPGAAFASLARALKPSGRLVFVCWRGLEENPWMHIPQRAVAPFVPPRPTQQPGDPGPFGLAEPSYTARVLREGGFHDIVITTLDVSVRLSSDAGVEGALAFTTQVGPAAAALRGMDDATRVRAEQALREALAPHATPQGITLVGASWIVSATVTR